MKLDHVVEAAEAGERADVVVTRRAGVPRSSAQAALRSGEVTVNAATVRPSHRLAAGDIVVGDVAEPITGGPQGEDIEVDVRYEDERVLVVSKPAGLVTHPSGGHPDGTLVNALIGRGGSLAAAGSQRPGLVHRLDRDTSGLLLVAKDDEALAFLTDALARRAVGRRYLALVRGAMSSGSGTIEAPVGRHPARPRLMAVVGGGRPAVTHFSTLAQTASVALLDVTLETGRTHQIRVHLSHVGHPIVGDRTYGGGGELASALGLARPFLHAAGLTFPHPGGTGPVEVHDPLPPDLIAAMAAAGIDPP
ncbi:MAG: RluA family pseudouridine synthase [Actinomycetota bacterium]|nr:RluA family pseudouridine synthase [Actinomycetota bacterium]